MTRRVPALRNARVAAWTPATLPPDWPAWRDRWETAHAVTAGLALVALIALALPARRAPSPEAGR